MLKAYYTYKRDENFFKQAEVLNKEYKLLMNLVFEGEIYPELDQDPSFLSNVQFEVCHKHLLCFVGILE